MATSFAFAFAFASVQPLAEPAEQSAVQLPVASALSGEANNADTPAAGNLITTETIPESAGAGPGPAEPATATPAPSTTVNDVDLAAPKPFPDPLEGINRISYAITQPIDRFILRPAAMTYKALVPKPLRDGARNAIGNVRAPVTFANDLLQLRPGRALRTLGRFLINSTIGVFGLFDIAKRKPFDLPRRDNGFGNTLGYYGIGPVVYLYLPVLGPTTLRDTAAQFGDGLIDNRLLDKAIFPNSGRRILRDDPDLGTAGTVVTVVNGLDQRAENDFELRSFREDSVDPYAALRANYLQNRAGNIAELKARDGHAPVSNALDDPLIDPEAQAPGGPTGAEPSSAP